MALTKNISSKTDLLIHNAVIITMDPDNRVIKNGFIAITGNKISNIGEDNSIDLSEYDVRRSIDLHGSIIHPGYIDTHIHLLYQPLRWVQKDGISATDAMSVHSEYLNNITPEIEEISYQLASLEMAYNGTTCFLEANVIDTDIAASAVEKIGIRAVIGTPGIKDIYEENSYFGPIKFNTNRAFDLIDRELTRNQNENALVQGAISLHGMGTASDELLLHAKSIADKNNVIINMHQSYAEDDTASDYNRFNQHPMVHYEEIGFLGSNCTFAHVNFVRDEEIPPILKSGCSIAWCPLGSMMYGIGGTTEGKHSELYKKGAKISLGSDSANWTTSFDIGNQALIAILTAREKTKRPDALLAEDGLIMATKNGARALGLENKIGSLEIGKKADLIIRKNNLPEMFPQTDPIRSVIYSGKSSIQSVVVDGNFIVDNGKSTLIDENELYYKVNNLKEKYPFYQALFN